MYAGLLLWSGVYRYLTPVPPVPEPRKTGNVAEFDGTSQTGRKIRIAYKDSGTGRPGELPVVLVHGSPGDGGTFDSLAGLFPNRRFISPDLPGFGYSEAEIPDYSMRAHAEYLIAFLDELEIEKAHFVGFSLGGGVIAHLSQLRPDRTASLSFVSSIGVEEYEMFGDHFVNRLFHGLQLGLIWGLKELTPHFGVFDGMPWSYARNFWDTDQRPMSGLLNRIEQPTLILHGKEDPLVPVEAARESARRLAQSEYHELNDDHFFIFLRPWTAEPILSAFWKNVENGSALSRKEASVERLRQSEASFKPVILNARGVTAFCFFLLIAFLAFINEDVAFLLAGLFAAQEKIGPGIAAGAPAIGILTSFICFYFVGSRYRKVFRSTPNRGSTENRFALDDVLLTSRTNGFRSVSYVKSGASKAGFLFSAAQAAGSALLRGVIYTGFPYLFVTLIAGWGFVKLNDTALLFLLLFAAYCALLAARQIYGGRSGSD